MAAKGRRDIAFCLVGDGAERERLEQRVRQAGLQHQIVFTGRQPKTAIPGILASSSACLVHLKNCALFQTVIPSKIFEAMAMGLPIAFAGPPGEASAIIEAAGAGRTAAAEDPAALADMVRELHADADGRAALAAASLAAAPDHSREVQADRMMAVLRRVAGAAEI